MANEKMNEIRKTFAARVKQENLSDDFALRDLGLDSLDIVEMCLDFEDTYGFKFTTDELKNIVTVGDLMNLIEKKIA